LVLFLGGTGTNTESRIEKMSDELILCPLCKGEIPFDTESCNFCGAVLAPGPNRNTPILKGVVCKNCGEKNYDYDRCNSCNQDFVIACPECGSDLRLSDQKCESCGLSIRKFNKIRKKDKPENTSKLQQKYAKYSKAAAGAVLGVAILLVVMWLFFPNELPVEIIEEKVENPRPIDRDQDGVVDRWEHFNEAGMRDWTKESLSADGQANKISFFDSNDKVLKVQSDTDGNDHYEKIEFYRDGILRSAFFYEGGDRGMITKYETYSALGKSLLTYLDDNEDGVFEKHYQYDREGRVHLEAFDSKGKGHIDTYIFYNKDKQIVSRGQDADGDGAIEKMTYLSPEGQTLREDTDEDGDAWPEKRILYHISGKVRSIEFDTDSDGLFDKFESYTKKGIYARTGFDINGDGKVDRWE
jgi:antitoxin component YwqK of YwqJK toxin-antitoxin module